MQKLTVITYITLILSAFMLSGLIIGNLFEKGGDFLNLLPPLETTDIKTDSAKTTTKDSITYVIDAPSEDVAYSTEITSDSSTTETTVIEKNLKDESPEH